MQTHSGERNLIGGFRPFQTPNSGFLFSSFFFHTGQVHQLQGRSFVTAPVFAADFGLRFGVRTRKLFRSRAIDVS